jgi:hypothetical protein
VIRMPQPRVTSSHLPEDATLRHAELREALMKLHDGERRVLVLRLYLDLPWTEVAAAAGVTEAGGCAARRPDLIAKRSVRRLEELGYKVTIEEGAA